MWLRRTGGWDGATWQRGFGAYVKYFHATADKLAECGARSAADSIAASGFGGARGRGSGWALLRGPWSG
jgi:hypothetical protein